MAKKIAHVSGFMSFNPENRKYEPSSAVVQFADGTYKQYYRGHGKGIPKYIQAAMKKQPEIK